MNSNLVDVYVPGDAWKNIMNEMDPPRPKKEGVEKVISIVMFVVNLTLLFGLPFFENVMRAAVPWGYTPSSVVPGVPHFFGLVMLFNGVLNLLFVNTFVVGKVMAGRKKFDYSLPIMYPAIDMHVEDIMNGGSIFSGGDVELARKKLSRAVGYACHQRAHGQVLEMLPHFLVLSFCGGLRYPFATAIYGLLGLIGRVAWINGYLSGTPVSRYKSPLAIWVWVATIGVLINTIGTIIGCFQ